MQIKALITSASAALVLTIFVGPAFAQQDKSTYELGASQEKYTSGGFKPAPGTMTTRFGTLGFPGGYPTKETAQKVYDELDLQRATQLYLDMYPALSMRGMMIGTARDYGSHSCSDVAVTADRLDSNALFPVIRRVSMPWCCLASRQMAQRFLKRLPD